METIKTPFTVAVAQTLPAADKAAADTGRLYGIWLDGLLVGGVLFRTMDVARGLAEAGCWLEPAAVGKGLVTRAVRVSPSRTARRVSPIVSFASRMRDTRKTS